MNQNTLNNNHKSWVFEKMFILLKYLFLIVLSLSGKNTIYFTVNLKQIFSTFFYAHQIAIHVLL